LLAAIALAALLMPADAEAQVRAGRLPDGSCVASDFTSFDDVVMNSVATHDGGGGDVYQAICDSADCFGYSINRLSGVNLLTTGLTPGEYTWYVCAWNGSVRRVVANLTGGPALFLRRSAPDRAVVDIADEAVPEGIRRFYARLQRTPATVNAPTR
jgi:hypothetical protein